VNGEETTRSASESVPASQPEQNERKEKREESAARGGVVDVFGFIIFPFNPLQTYKFSSATANNYSSGGSSLGRQSFN
jgi:hypothetical protein